MEKRTFSTARKSPSKPKPPRTARVGGSSRRPVVAAPPPGNNKKLIFIGCGAGALLLILVIALAGGNRQPQRRPAATTVSQPKGATVGERMVNQRYEELGGLTVKEWQEQNGDSDFAKQRREARKNR